MYTAMPTGRYTQNSGRMPFQLAIKNSVVQAVCRLGKQSRLRALMSSMKLSACVVASSQRPSNTYLGPTTGTST
jgi:hypothetical protein